MFIQYLKHNFGAHPIQYVLLILSIVFMLTVSVIANGIMLDNISDDMAWIEAHYSYIIFEDVMKMSEFRDDINEFLDKSPVEIGWIGIEARDSDTHITYAPDYDSLRVWGKDFGGVEDFAEEQYLNSEKVSVVGTGMWPGDKEHIYTDDDHILIAGEEFLIIGKNSVASKAYVLYDAAPENTPVSSFEIYVSGYSSREQMKEFKKLVNETLIKDRATKYAPEYLSADSLLATRKTVSNIVISAFVQIISAFNALLLFKYMLDMRKKYFAVLRLCGFGKSSCVKYSFGELMLVCVISAALACAAVGLLRPVLAHYIDIFNVMFDAGHMAVFALCFPLAAAIVFAVYIMPSLGKSVARELREM